MLQSHVSKGNSTQNLCTYEPYGGILEGVIFLVKLSINDVLNFSPDRDQGVNKRSSSFLSSLSVGSIIIVPGTGHDMVGAWKP